MPVCDDEILDKCVIPFCLLINWNRRFFELRLNQKENTLDYMLVAVRQDFSCGPILCVNYHFIWEKNLESDSVGNGLKVFDFFETF